MKYYIFLTVVFDNYSKPYFYLTNDTKIKIDDCVLVDTKDGQKECKVIDVCVYTDNNLPRPLNETKYIIGRMGKVSSKKENEEFNIILKQFNENSFKSFSFESGNNCPLSKEQLVIDKNKQLFLRGFKSLSGHDNPWFFMPDGYEKGIVGIVQGVYPDPEEGDYYSYESETNIKVLFVPQSYKEIYLHRTSELEEVYLSKGVKIVHIDSCTNLRKLFIPDTIESINFYGDPVEVFSYTLHSFIYLNDYQRNIKKNECKIIVDPNNQHYRMQDGLLYFVYEEDEHEEPKAKELIWFDDSVKEIHLKEAEFLPQFSRNGSILYIEDRKSFSFLIKNNGKGFDSDTLAFFDKIVFSFPLTEEEIRWMFLFDNGESPSNKIYCKHGCRFRLYDDKSWLLKDALDINDFKNFEKISNDKSGLIGSVHGKFYVRSLLDLYLFRHRPFPGYSNNVIIIEDLLELSKEETSIERIKNLSNYDFIRIEFLISLSINSETCFIFKSLALREDLLTFLEINEREKDNKGYLKNTFVNNNHKYELEIYFHSSGNITIRKGW